MAGKKVKVFLGILIMLALSLGVITLNLDSITLTKIQLSPTKGFSAWQSIDENSQIAYLVAIGSCLVMILMIELILLRRMKYKHQQDLTPAHLATLS